MGQFVLTGSANLLEMRRVNESLAGRAAYTTLWPMSRREQLGQGVAGTWSDFFTTATTDWLDMVQSTMAIAADWRELARVGGYPTPAVEQTTADERALWFQGYIETYLPDGRLLAIECKSGDRPSYDDADGLRLFLGEYPAAIGGLLLHRGTETRWIADRVLSMPWCRVM